MKKSICKIFQNLQRMKKKLIKKHQKGSQLLDAATYAIPIYGTYRTIKDAYHDPSAQNIAWAGVSVLSDLLSGAGIGNAMNAAVASGKAAKVTKAANKVAPKVVKVVKEAKPVWLTPEYSKMSIASTSPTVVGSKLGVSVDKYQKKKEAAKHQKGGNIIKKIVSFPADLFHGRINFSENDEVTKTPFGNVRKKTVIDGNNNMYEETIVEPNTGIAPAASKAEKLLHGLNGNIYRLLPNGKVQQVIEKEYFPGFQVNTINALREKAYRALKNKPFSEDRFPSYTRLKTR